MIIFLVDLARWRTEKILELPSVSLKRIVFHCFVVVGLYHMGMVEVVFLKRSVAVSLLGCACFSFS